MKSLRLRLALTSTAISGIVIIGFGLAGWMLTVGMLQEAVDLRLSVPLDRTVRELHPRGDIKRTLNSLEIGFGDEVTEGKRLILIKGRGGAPVYQAPEGDWVSEIDLALLKPLEDLGGESDRPPTGDGERPSPKPGEEFDLDQLIEEERGEGPGRPKGEPGRFGPPGEDRRPHSPPLPSGMPKVEFHTLKVGGHLWRAGVIRDHGHLVLMATELSGLESEIRRVRSLFFLSLPVCLLVIGFGGWFVADRAMRPVNIITETASRITAHGLDQRIPKEAHDYHELSRLVEVLNGMMNRLEHSFRHAMRFSADVSHELKTPLTVLQAAVQTALKACDPGSTAEQNLIVVSQEAQRLSLITRSLMLLAQADAGQLSTRKETFSLSDEVEALGEDAEILCEKAGLTLEIAIAQGIMMCSDNILIRQALQNLVSNAVKYNQPDGVVSFRLYRDPVTAEAIFEISNTGPGIPENDREKIFDRFYRVDRARSRNIDGFGLGLNLAWEIVRAIEGELILRNASAEITRFEIRFGQ